MEEDEPDPAVLEEVEDLERERENSRVEDRVKRKRSLRKS